MTTNFAHGAAKRKPSAGHSREGGNPVHPDAYAYAFAYAYAYTHAHAHAHAQTGWIPAFAGITGVRAVHSHS